MMETVLPAWSVVSSSKAEGLLPPHRPSEAPHKLVADAPFHGTRGNEKVVVGDFCRDKTSSLTAAQSLLFFCSLSLVYGVVELKKYVRFQHQKQVRGS